MELKRLTEWLGTAEGLGKAVLALAAVVGAMWAGMASVIDKVAVAARLPAGAALAGAGALVALFGVVLWRGFRRFARASRLEQPDAFTLRPTGPDTLIGRDEDLTRLIACVRHNRLVLLDGESGCGKSALVGAGLIPMLHTSDGLLPVALRDWGDDWVRGPLAGTLGALFQAVAPADRERLGWSASPDLAADTAKLAADLDARLKAVFETLGRRPLLVADQFDDHQARHRGRFLDAEGNWLPPSALSRANRFWKLVGAGLTAGRLHLLVVTRSDTASGLAGVRFLGEEQTAARTVARVEAEYLRPLLAGIAADDAEPPVVSHPEGGWQELRDVLEHDLKAEGAILMQQVRTVLLGLRQLPLLTPARYRAAGGLRGVETLVISRSLRRAGDVAGGGEAGRRRVRALLSELILPGGPGQAPKARRATLAALDAVTGDAARSVAILAALQQDEVVRPAEAVGEADLWQLDHDYLARAVMAEARQADRWSLALLEGRALYDAAAGDWRRRWRALLPVATLARVGWERIRRRLLFGEGAAYVAVSGLKPAAGAALVALVFVGAVGWNRDRLLTAEATRIVNRLGSSGEGDAVLAIWRAPAPLRRRVYDLIVADDGRLELAVTSGWPLAHAGFEPDRARELAAVLLARLDRDRTGVLGMSAAGAYADMVGRLGDPAELAAATRGLRERAARERDEALAHRLLRAHTELALQVGDPAELGFAALELRRWLMTERTREEVGRVGRRYGRVVERLRPEQVRVEAAAWREWWSHPRADDLALLRIDAHRDVIRQLAEGDVKSEVAALRDLLGKQRPSEVSSRIANLYAVAATRLRDADDLRAAATFLRGLWESQVADSLYGLSPGAYSSVVTHLGAPDCKAESEAMEKALRDAPEGRRANLGSAYAEASTCAHDPAVVRRAAALLRSMMTRKGESSLTDAYVQVVDGLEDAADIRTEIAATRHLLEIPYAEGSDFGFDFRSSYAAAVVRSRDPSDATAALGVLGAMLARSRSQDDPCGLLDAYAQVAAHAAPAEQRRAAASVLWTYVERDERDLHYCNLLGKYASVVEGLPDDRDLGQGLASLRVRLEAETAGDGNDELDAYRSVVRRLRDPAALAVEARSLREALSKSRDNAATGRVVNAYEALLDSWSQVGSIKEEAAVLQDRLARETDTRMVSPWLHAYSRAATYLTDPGDRVAAATVVRARLERERDPDLASQMAVDYAKLVGEHLAEAKAAEQAVQVRQLITLAGHPFVDNSYALLAALKPLAKTDFGDQFGAAVKWSEATYGIKASQLRPEPAAR